MQRIQQDQTRHPRSEKEAERELNTTWESVEIITEYLNYISENLISFQQRALSTLCNDVIQKQQETIRQLQLNLENHVAQITKAIPEQENCENNWRISSTNCSCKRMNWRIAMLPAIRKEKCDTAISVEQLQIKLRLEEKKIQEALTEQNKLRKQLENSEYELKLQKNELTNSQAEKLTLQLLSEYESLQSRLQAIEKEKSNIAKLAIELESKLLLQEEEMQEALMEQNKLRDQIEDTKREFYSRKNELKSAHTEEKEILIKENQQLLSKLGNLQLQLMLQKDNSHKNSEYNKNLQEKLKEVSEKSKKNSFLRRLRRMLSKKTEVQFNPKIIKKSEKDQSHQEAGRKFFKSDPISITYLSQARN
nr:PREDICTED: protein MLP1-like [Linepithema humile]